MGEGRTLRVYGKEAEMREETSWARERGPGEGDMRILWQRIKVDCVKSEQTREGMCEELCSGHFSHQQKCKKYVRGLDTPHHL